MGSWGAGEKFNLCGCGRDRPSSEEEEEEVEEDELGEELL